MLETLREFGCHQSAHDDDVRRRHAAHWLAFAHTAEAELAGEQQAAWLDRMEVEHDNIRSALRWALLAAPDIALDLAGTMWRFWLFSGFATEGLEWIERSIGATAASPSAVRAPRADGCRLDV